MVSQATLDVKVNQVSQKCALPTNENVQHGEAGVIGAHAQQHVAADFTVDQESVKMEIQV